MSWGWRNSPRATHMNTMYVLISWISKYAYTCITVPRFALALGWRRSPRASHVCLSLCLSLHLPLSAHVIRHMLWAKFAFDANLAKFASSIARIRSCIHIYIYTYIHIHIRIYKIHSCVQLMQRWASYPAVSWRHSPRVSRMFLRIIDMSTCEHVMHSF